MTTDPNADLVGYALPVEMAFEVSEHEMETVIVDGTVTGSASWSSTYVEVSTELGPTIRVAAQVRRRKELE